MSEAPRSTAAVTAPRGGSLRRNAIANIAGRSASVLLWVFVTPFVLGRLGPERFAVWSLFLGIGGNVASLDLGMSNSVSRFVAVASARGDRRNLLLVMRRSLTLSAGIGLMWCLACVAGSQMIARVFHVPAALVPEVTRSLMVFAISMFIFSVTQVMIGTLIGLQRLDLSNLCYLSGLGVHAAVLVIGLTSGLGLMSAALAAICGHTLSGTISVLLVRRQLAKMPEGEAGEPFTWREMLRFGAAIQGTAVGSVGQQQAWNYLLGVLGQLRWVTQFALGFRVANAVWSLPNLVQGAVIPAAAHASADRDGDQLRRVYDWACRWIFALGGYVLGGLWLTAPALVLLWLGPNQSEPLGEAVRVTRVLAIAFAIGTLSGPGTAVARGGGWPLLETWNFTAAFVINVLFSLWLVPRYGPVGAATAMAISYGLAGAWLIVTLHRLLQVSTMTWTLKVLLPRFLIPAAVAALLWKVLPGGTPTGRIAALRVVALQGVAFTLLFALLSWPIGDFSALLAQARGRFKARAAAVPRAEA